MGIGFRLAEDAEQDRARAVVPTRGLIILDRIRHFREFAKPHRPVAARRHDDVAKLIGVRQFGLRLDGERLLGVFQRAESQ